jgi:D-3-phosphoglycerate dehydrogenase / 2-oxoglutarate reductase
MARVAFRVAATNPGAQRDFGYVREALDPIGAAIVPVLAEDEETYRAALADMDAVIPGPRVRLTANVIEGLNACKVIANGGIGFDSIDIEAATRAGIIVTNIPDLFVDEVADQALALLLAVNRKLLQCHTQATSNRWAETWTNLGSVPKLRGKTLGLVAFGNIARQVARRAQAFGLRVVASDPYVSAEVMSGMGVEPRTLEDLLRESDFVSIHAPLTRETRGLIDAARLKLMKPTAVLINTARGKVIDEAALIQALRDGGIAAAGLDVLAQEPPDPSNPLLKMPNVVVTPHMASYSDESNVARRRRLGEDIAAVLTGRRPAHVVNPAVLDKLVLV